MNDSQFSFRLEITKASSVAEIAGELWNIAKDLREGCIKRSYGNNLTPLNVEFEVRQLTRETSSSASAKSGVGPNGQPTSEAESTTTVTTKELVQTSKSKPQSRAQTQTQESGNGADTSEGNGGQNDVQNKSNKSG